jgi:hypothetical protein
MADGNHTFPGQRGLSLGGQHTAPSSRLLVRRFVRDVKQSTAHYRNGVHLAIEKSLTRLLGGESRRILMSDAPEWADRTKDEIRTGFSHTHHKMEFGTVSPLSFAQYDLVVPWALSDLKQFRQWPQSLVKNTIPIPSEESVSLCDDKYQFSRTLIDKGFGSYIPRLGIGLGQAPYILKKRTGVWGKECWMIRDRDDELQFLDQLNDPAYFSQEIIRGPREFATHILFANGRIVKSLNIMYEFDTDLPIKGQDRWSFRVIYRCPYLRLFARILTSIGFQGLCCVNYKVARRRPYLLEINPRFGASLAPYFFSFIRHLNFD